MQLPKHSFRTYLKVAADWTHPKKRKKRATSEETNDLLPAIKEAEKESGHKSFPQGIAYWAYHKRKKQINER